METLLRMNETDLYDGLELDNGPFFDNSSFSGNSTVVATTWGTIVLMCLASIFLAFIILSTIIGNVLVVVAVAVERNLQNVANRLIVSLSVADLMVSCFVMGPAAHYMICLHVLVVALKCNYVYVAWPWLWGWKPDQSSEKISGSWHFGAIGCDLWTSADVLCCSSSILHLVAVATDRYLTVTTVNWTVNRNVNHINLMILCVWVVSFLVSVLPLLGWKDPHFWDRIADHRCMVSPDVGYQVFATVSTFYAPTVLILILYWKIWQTAKTRIRHRVGQTNNHKLPTSTSITTIAPAKIAISSTFSGDELSCHTATVETSTDSVVCSPVGAEEVQEMEQIQSPVSVITCDEESGGVNPSIGPSDDQQLSLRPPCSPFRASQASLSSPDLEANSSNQVSNSNKRMKDLQKKKESLEAKRERKAAKTLAIVTGAFMLCWLPFFVSVLLMALCSKCSIPEEMANAFQWLGYINSTFNPIIYTIFNPEFRQAFKRILFGRQSKASRRRH